MIGYDSIHLSLTVSPGDTTLIYVLLLPSASNSGKEVEVRPSPLPIVKVGTIREIDSAEFNGSSDSLTIPETLEQTNSGRDRWGRTKTHFRHRDKIVITDSMLFGTLDGVVQDENGEGIPGATVALLGTTRGAATKLNGNFIVPKVRPGTYSIIFTAIGYRADTVNGVVVRHGESTVLNATLIPKEYNRGCYFPAPETDPDPGPIDPLSTGTIHILRRENLYD